MICSNKRQLLETTKMRYSEKNLLRKVPNLNLKHIKRMDNNCHIPDLVQAFSYVEKWLIKPSFKPS